MNGRDNISACLAAVGAVDPSARIFTLLFSQYPEFESYFVLDRSGAVRGSMLQQSFEIILDYVDGGCSYSLHLVGARYNHDTYEVAPEEFLSFFSIIGLWLATDFPREWERARDEWHEMESHFKEIVLSA